MKVQIKTKPDHPERVLSLLRWSRNILFAIGILAVGYYGYAVTDARIFQGYQRRQFERSVKSAPSDFSMGEAHNAQIPTEASLPVVASSSASGVSAVSHPGNLLGQLEIKKIGLAVMVLEGVDNRSLRRAVGHIPETALPGQPGNVAIAGHRDTFFRELRNITKGDEITLTTLQGPIRYAVDFSEVVGPNDTGVLNPSSDSILTLVTCYPFYYVGPAPKRLIVRAHMIPD
jgi:sortase A